ncbi:MAG: hypothetical protein ACOC9Y_03670 [Chloroflexota bacterium]
MNASQRSWMETMNYIASDPGRPAILIVLAQNNGAPLDEYNLATRAGMFHQQLSGQAVETAIMVKHIIDLGNEGFITRAEDGYKWEMTPLGILVSRQWVPGNIEPETDEPLTTEQIREWRDRIIKMMDYDVGLAEEAGVPKDQWLMTQSQRLTELVVLNKVLGEQEIPEWLRKMRDEGVISSDDLSA